MVLKLETVTKYKAYLSRQVVFRLAIDVSLVTSQRELRILAKSTDLHVDFVDYVDFQKKIDVSSLDPHS